MNYAVLHLADFALQAVLRTAAGPVNRPVALLSAAGSRAVVLAPNAAARAAGVITGLTASQAQARCAGLELHSQSSSAEREAAAVLLVVAGSLSPQVEYSAPGVVTLDLRGRDPVTNLPHGRAALDRLQAHGLTATLGIARTPLLALYAARQAVLVGEITDEHAFLAPLPLALAEPPEEIAPILAGWGVRTCGQLTALPKESVGRRLGPAGLALWERAAGGNDRPLVPVAPRARFAADLALEHPLETLEPLLFVLRRLLDRLGLQLGQAGLATAVIHLRLALTDGPAHTRTFRLSEPTTSTELLFRTLHTHLETLQTPAPIAAVALEAIPTTPRVRQHGIFETGLRDPHGFAGTLARLGALLGLGRVGTPALEDTRRPDAFRLHEPPPVVPPAIPTPVLPAIGLPLRRFRPALTAQVEAGRLGPSRLHCDLARGPVRTARGPWRGSGDWWRTEAWAREEWDVELAGGGLYRLVHTARGWFVEGMYD